MSVWISAETYRGFNLKKACLGLLLTPGEPQSIAESNSGDIPLNCNSRHGRGSHRSGKGLDQPNILAVLHVERMRNPWLEIDRIFNRSA